MNAHKVAATLTQDGILVLQGLPFYAGDAVEIIILEQAKAPQPSESPQVEISTQSSMTRYNNSFAAVSDVDYLTAVAETLTEWGSEADEIAYSNL
jgi:hypothetical protein